MIASQNFERLTTEIVVDYDAVCLWKTNLDWPPADVAGANEILSPEERNRAARFHREFDRRRFIVARAVLRMILGRYCNVPPEKIAFTSGEFGKPRLQSDLAEPDVRFNLAHSGDAALYAVAMGQDIGVDIEAIRTDSASADIARRFFAAEELSALVKLPKNDFISAFFRCWTRKEAYMKATGLGLSMPLDGFVVPVEPALDRPLLVKPLEKAIAGRWEITDFDVGGSFAAALCIDARTKSAPRIAAVRHLRAPSETSGKNVPRIGPIGHPLAGKIGLKN